MHRQALARFALVTAGSLTLLVSGPPGPAVAASAPGWRIVRIFPAVQQDLSVSASGPGSAWAAGVDTAGYRLNIQRWDGRSWQRIGTPPHLGSVDGNDPYVPIGSSSAGNAWAFPLIQHGSRVRADALHWQHRHWTTQVLPAGVTISDTAVLGPAEAWAFGVRGSGAHATAYDLRWTGRSWHQVTLPGAPYQVSELSPADIWALGTTAATLGKPASKRITVAMHFNGHSWTSVRVPVPAPPRRGYLDAYIAAAGRRSAWFAYINFDHSFNFVSNGLLRWAAGHWQRLRLPARFTDFLNSAAPDGHRGLWICSPSQIYHYAHARWTLQHMAGKDPSCNALAWIPRTRSGWAVGAIRTPKLALQAAIQRYLR